MQVYALGLLILSTLILSNTTQIFYIIMLVDDIAYKKNPPQSKRKNTEDFSDWPDRDINKKFKRTPKYQRNKPVQGFSIDLNNDNRLKNTGIFQTNTVDPYPAVKPMGLTRFGDKQSLYTTGDLEHDTASGISSAVVRGDTDDMSVPNLEGTDFDNVRHSKKYGKPYVPLTQQEKDQLISQVYADRHVPVITGDDFDNMQSAGKSRKRRSKTRKKRRSKRKTKKQGRRNKKRYSRKK